MRISTNAFFLSFVTGFVIILSSCQKEIHVELDKPTGNDSTLLEKFVLVDTTVTPPNDTVYYFKVVYDANKRASKLFRVDFNGTLKDTVLTYNYFYTGSDTLPFKMVMTSAFGVDQVYLSYDGQGKVIIDSTIENYATGATILTVERYTYMAGLVKANIKLVDAQGNTSTYAKNYYQARTGSNIFTQSDTSFASVPGYAVNLNHQYDNKPNPLKILFPGVYPYYQGEELIDENMSDNNFVETYCKREEVNPSSLIDIDHLVYHYIYTANGLPKVAWERDVDNGTVDKYFYLYTK